MKWRIDKVKLSNILKWRKDLQKSITTTGLTRIFSLGMIIKTLTTAELDRHLLSIHHRMSYQWWSRQAGISDSICTESAIWSALQISFLVQLMFKTNHDLQLSRRLLLPSYKTGVHAVSCRSWIRVNSHFHQYKSKNHYINHPSTNNVNHRHSNVLAQDKLKYRPLFYPSIIVWFKATSPTSQ